MPLFESRGAAGRGVPGVISGAAASERLTHVAFQDTERVLQDLHTTRAGLTDAEAEQRAAAYGRNEIGQEQQTTWVAALLSAGANPFNYLLAALAVMSVLTGDRRAAILIGTMVGLSTVLRFLQEYRSNKAAQALQALVRSTATVERADDAFDPAHSSGSSRRELSMAELVPGDVVYLSAGDMIPADLRLLAAKDLFVAQSSLTGEAMPVEKMARTPQSGEPLSVTELPTLCLMGTSVVSGTGTAVVINTGSSTIIGHMAKRVAGRRAETAFDTGVQRVSWLFIRFLVVMVPFVFFINGFTKGDWLEALLFGLAIAVGLTPELLPTIVTVNLAKGAVTMSRHKTIVKRLNAIQNLGAMDVLCTDKTGTLTQDKVVLERHVNIAGDEDEWVLALAYLNAYYQTGLKNLLDIAVLEHAELQQELAVDHAYGKVDEIPFDFTRRRMSVVVDHEGHTHQLICKGAVEEVLAVCEHAYDAGRAVPIDAQMLTRIHTLVDAMNEDGFRVVGVAYREYSPRRAPYTVRDEAHLILAGFIGFLDPPKESAAPALRALGAQGIAVKILTGDNALVSRKICHDVGLEPGDIVHGSEISTLDDAALGDVAARGRLFCKLTPDDKVRVVRALKGRGHTVGFLGDGINDAGGLREADVGISVDSAVDIAKESADVILLEKSLMVVSDGVIEGRKTFGNTVKYIKMTASSNFGNVLSVLVASTFLPFLPMLPLQLLSVNLLYDLSQASIPLDDMDADYLTVPRQWKADDIRRFMMCIGPLSSVFDIATFALMWCVFGANTPDRQGLFQSGWFIESLATQTLIIHTIRTAKVPFLQSRATWPVFVTTAVCVAVGILLPHAPLGRQIGLLAPPPMYFLWLVAILLSYVTLTQLVKQWYIRHFGQWL